jgi:hypothetical protein
MVFRPEQKMAVIIPNYNTCTFCDYQSICDAKEIEEG